MKIYLTFDRRAHKPITYNEFKGRTKLKNLEKGKVFIHTLRLYDEAIKKFRRQKVYLLVTEVSANNKIISVEVK